MGLNAAVTIEGQEKPVQTFLLADFLKPFNWPESKEDLRSYNPREPHEPRDHQLEEINDVCTKIDGRGQLIMACGTGKTLTGLVSRIGIWRSLAATALPHAHELTTSTVSQRLKPLCIFSNHAGNVYMLF